MTFKHSPVRPLCVWGDAGWGGLVRQGKYQDGHYSDELVEACKRLMLEWNPQPVPAWVTCIPSLRHPDLVPNFARRLAEALNLPFHLILEKTDAEVAAMICTCQKAKRKCGFNDWLRKVCWKNMPSR
jgi:ATP-dependent DNA helicase RecQ